MRASPKGAIASAVSILKTHNLLFALGLCGALSPLNAHAEGVLNSLGGVPSGDSGPNATEAVAYLTYGLGEGSGFTFPDGSTGSVSETGRGLTSNDPYGWELHYPDGVSSSIISVQQRSACRYLMTIATYKSDRRFFNDPPSMIKYELDFTGVNGVRIASGRSQLDGVKCSSVENGDNVCRSATAEGITNTGTQERADEVFRQLRQHTCQP